MDNEKDSDQITTDVRTADWVSIVKQCQKETKRELY